MSKIYIPAAKPEDWQSLLADPDKHWRKGYSARALACCWQEADGVINGMSITGLGLGRGNPI